MVRSKRVCLRRARMVRVALLLLSLLMVVAVAVGILSQTKDVTGIRVSRVGGDGGGRAVTLCVRVRCLVRAYAGPQESVALRVCRRRACCVCCCAHAWAAGQQKRPCSPVTGRHSPSALQVASASFAEAGRASSASRRYGTGRPFDPRPTQHPSSKYRGSIGRQRRRSYRCIQTNKSTAKADKLQKSHVLITQPSTTSTPHLLHRHERARTCNRCEDRYPLSRPCNRSWARFLTAPLTRPVAPPRPPFIPPSDSRCPSQSARPVTRSPTPSGRASSRSTDSTTAA